MRYLILFLFLACTPIEDNFVERRLDSDAYHFVEECHISNGIKYPVAHVCNITYNDVYMSGGVITITSDCPILTDGFYMSTVTDMSFQTDEILLLGEGIILAHPAIIDIITCNENQITLRYTRASDGDQFLAYYQKD